MNRLPDVNKVLLGWLGHPVVGSAITVIAGLAAIALLVSLLRRHVVNRYIVDADLRYHARKVLGFAGYLIGALYAAAVLGGQVSRLTVAFGIAGAGIAFALQEVIMSLAGWVAIIFGDFYRIGDRIQLGGVRGDVIDIGVFRTMVMECGAWVDGDLYNGRMVRVANSYVFKEPVYNYSDDFPFLWDEVRVPVRHGSDAALARALLLEVAQEVVGDYVPVAQQSWREVVSQYRIDAASVAPAASMVFDENWMTFTLRYVVDYKVRRAIKDGLSVRILEAFAGTDGKVVVASTSVDVKLTDVPPVDLVRRRG